MRATVVKHHDSATLPAIRATIVAGANDVGIRISDEGTCLISFLKQSDPFTEKQRWRALYTPKSNKNTFRSFFILPHQERCADGEFPFGSTTNRQFKT